MIIEIALIAFAVLLMALNVAATYQVQRSEYYERMQKRFQIAVIWFLPLAGALLCLELVRQQLHTPSGQYRRSDDSSRGLDFDEDVNFDTMDAPSRDAGQFDIP